MTHLIAFVTMFSALSHFVFGASSLFSSHNQSDDIKTSSWKDKKLCFDLRAHDLELNRGEQLIGCFYPIEDVKGNQDELGLLKVTNLRLIWICVKKKRVNLSIGWRTVTMTYEQNLKDALCGTATSLFVLSKYESTKYEFVFARQSNQADIWSSEVSQDSWRMMSQLRRLSQDRATVVDHLSPMYLDDPFDVVLKVWHAYKQTHLFRHCRSNINYLVAGQPQASGEEPPSSLKISDINLLPSEQIIEVFANVYQNESNAVRYMGSLLLTNVRLIWIDSSIHLRNLSIPHIRIESIKLRPSDRIIVNTNDYLASSTQVEFQAQKAAQSSGANSASKAAKVIFEQIQNLHILYKSKPRYGPESCEECVDIMSHLRPLKLYFDSIDKSMIEALENFGPEASTARVQERTTTNASSISVTRADGNGSQSSEDDVERAEKELDGYASKLINYLEERPLELDMDLIYWTDLGLAMERPANGASISSIWRINV